MRLKKIRLAGFKSFVDPTNIPFPDDMTAIVGPNGCGKSNVIDAVRWVLGESSAKNLRGDAMTDVIFNGSTARKPVSQSSVELVFENAGDRIEGEYAQYNELSIKRVVTREAISTYYLNGNKCRRRDVTDLFLGTGLGPRSYAIIEQGMISRLIESKPQDLRIFIEEAAGISKYKERRRDTENRIRHTKDNLERLTDVRDELGQQIDKLQRQAAAARRYKELKAQERTLKGQLAAIRWVKYSDLCEGLETRIEELENQLQAFVAKQRGSEKGMLEYQQQQADFKQQQDDIQQQLFKLSNEITRLEQNQLHQKMRRQQISQEIDKLAFDIGEQQAHQQADEAQLEELEMQAESLEPQTEMLEMQLEQLETELESKQQQFDDKQANWRQSQQQQQQCEQRKQLLETQLSSLNAMQQRTSQRLMELQQEQQLLQQVDSDEHFIELEEAVEQAEAKYNEMQHASEALQAQHQQLGEQQRELNNQLNEQKSQLAELNAELRSLKTLQAASQDNSFNQWLEQQQLASRPLWEILQVEPQWQSALETALQHVIASPVVAEYLRLPTNPGSQLLFEHSMTTDKPANTLASKVTSDKLPNLLTQILLAPDIEQAEQQVLQPGQSVITQNGYWRGQDWALFGSKNNQSGVLERAAKIEELENTLPKLHGDIEQLNEQLAQNEQLQQQNQSQRQQQQNAQQQAYSQLTEKRSELQVARQQQQQSQQRLDKLHQDIELTNEQLEQEQLQQEDMSEQLQEIAMQAEELAMQLPELEQQKELAENNLTLAKQQAEQIKQQQHQHALNWQTVNSQLQSRREGMQRAQKLVMQLSERHQQLQSEQQELHLPMEEQAEQMQIWLEQRAGLESQRIEVAQQLSEVEAVLADSQKGQQAINEQISQLRSQQESLRVESEGHRVRANAVLEQLPEIDMGLKQLLEDLPAEAEEGQWQKDLDKVQQSVSRLGAVNLAAVEEFEIQSERKRHLDTQHEDLTSAMETLEDAIRKIDRETRSRFKHTFTQVNEDLQMLFPKVFGGGAASLELTEDDLLETGVTIMAQPPGKKNSTIHLLSGGEKALTALSLVFAIFRLNPAPFCMLDEVDAPLDDANVMRFCKLVSEMSKSVQFIYITHNKIAMEMATHLTGVTMAEPGVSRMVAVDVEEAVALAEA
ncbi:chromosome segregation protein SMC [Neptunicella marina]|uniref:Chromosome partition protein Smc n=1 Tax=Neptunicella marina TaxID=2125989 RepID=A0A8J6IS52_9ALTE|nr:chromosome segregation protein SMC [Neptunicella marina]MBC3764727.1 chromosome segregation protein SMC [Neptunicella marina]